MLNRFCKCGQKLSLAQMLGNGICRDCHNTAQRAMEEALTARKQFQEKAERQKNDELMERTLLGNASEHDIAILKSEGYLFVKKQLISCPVCQHKQFKRHPAFVDIRTPNATLIDLDFLNQIAHICICINCSHILWFAEEIS